MKEKSLGYRMFIICFCAIAGHLVIILANFLPIPIPIVIVVLLILALIILKNFKSTLKMTD